MTMMVSEPVFVTPHAIVRFRERVADIAPKEVINVIQKEVSLRQRLIEPHRPGQVVYRGRFRRIWFFMVMSHGEGDWPAVTTIVGPKGPELGNLCKGKAWIRHQSVTEAMREAAAYQEMVAE